MRRLAYRVLSCAAAAAVLAQPLRAQHLASAASIASLPAPVLLDTTGMFQAKFARLGDDIFIGGQPTEKALRDLRAQGVTVVVNLRTPEEMGLYLDACIEDSACDAAFIAKALRDIARAFGLRSHAGSV